MSLTAEALQRHVVILANGDFPQREDLLHILNAADYLVCCDGAANTCHRHGIEPHAIVGDCDSLKSEVRTRYSDRIFRISEQESNDLSKAFHHALALGYRHFTLLGTTGKREDHFLGNFSLLMDYDSELRALGEPFSLRMLSDFGCFYPCRDNVKLHPQVGQEISVFNFGATALRSEGLEYPLYDVQSLWQGTLNKAISTEVSISAKGAFMVYVAEFD